MHIPTAAVSNASVQTEGNYIAHAAAGYAIGNSTWRSMRVSFSQVDSRTNNIKVFVNGGLVIDANHVPPLGAQVAFPSTALYYGLAARTGGATNQHYVRNIQFLRHRLELRSELEFVGCNFSGTTWANTGSWGAAMNATAFGGISLVEGGNVLQFNRASSQYLSIPGTLTWDNFTSRYGFTFVGAVRFSTTPGSWERIFEFGNGPSNGNFNVARYQTTDQANLDMYNGSTSAGLQLTNAGFIDSNWHVYACVYAQNGTSFTFKAFRDSTTTLWRNSTVTFDAQNRTTTMNYIGRSNWSADAFFQGQMRHLKVWARSLSDAELENEMYLMRIKYGI